MARYGMVIDLHKCTGCGACGLGCKTENNTDDRADGQTHNWADYRTVVSGKFPNVKLEMLPVLCNHCSDAPCVKACPVTPKAMHKNAKGMTIHNQERCIGCRACQYACPYSQNDVAQGSNDYSVISFNDFGKTIHAAYQDKTEIIKGCTTSGAEIAKKAGFTPPHATNYGHPDYKNIRTAGVVEKCILCDHRIENGMKPYCTDVCPSSARVAGDLDDPHSDAAKLVKQYGGRRLKNNKGEFLAANENGVGPNIYYIRTYSARK
ncbi:MAG: 4Fe-4S dicluster domain-containing protein [Desulfuromonadales bacterium]|nr:4Fe-4S dicluster domain-containing protein [Desulfuromonadales bacterium]